MKKKIRITLGYLDNKMSKTERKLAADTFIALTKSQYTIDLMEKIEAEPDEEKKNELKGQLFAALFMCQYSEDRPTLATAQPTGYSIQDYDHMDVDVREFYNKNIAGHEEEHKILLAHITPRGKGLRLVTEMNPGETPEMCQIRVADELGLTAYRDDCVKDITRISFIPSYDYILFMNRDMFDTEREVDVPEDTENETVPQTMVATHKYETCPAVAEQLPAAFAVPMSFQYQGLTYDTIIRQLLARLATDGEPKVGERNVVLYSLVRELRHITNYQFEMTRMLVAPYFADLPDAEIRHTINSAINSNGRTITPTMRGLLAELNNEKLPSSADEAMEWPRMPELPPLMKMLIGHYPKHLAPHVVLTLLPILGVYGTHIRFRYIDNRRSSLTFMVAVVGKSSAGKSYASHLFSATTKPLAEWDDRERKKNEEYQLKLDRRKQDEAYPDDPKAKVRIYSDDITTSQLLEYQDNLGDEHGIQFTEEVDRMSKARKSHFADNDDLYCRSYDNAVGGKESKSRQTRNIRTRLHINTLFCGTPGTMHAFYNNPEGGLNNRIIFVSMPRKRSRGCPRYEDLNAEEEALLNNTITYLWNAGTQEAEEGKTVNAGDPVHFGKEYTFPFLDKGMNSWIRKCDREDLENPDETWRDLANRAASTGYRAGVLAWFLWGCPQDDATIRKVVRFMIWVAEVTRISIYNFCGDEYDRINAEQEKYAKTRVTKNKKLLSLLPEVFTTQDVVALRLQNGDSTNVRMVVSRWVDDGLIVKVGNAQFRKVKTIPA